MASKAELTRPQLQWLDESEGRALFDQLAQALLHISGEEFLSRWDAGEYRAVADDPEHPAVRWLAALIRLAR
jgi:hypothetical protein